MAHSDNDNDDDGSLEGIKITLEGGDGDVVKMSWDEFTSLLGGFLGEPVSVRLACGEEFELPGEAFVVMSDMAVRERQGWDARFANATSAEVASRLVDELLALGGAPSALSHIAATEHIWGEMFHELFARAGVAQDDPVNRITLKCDERTHLESFHAWVYQQLLAATEGADSATAKKSFVVALERVRGRLQMRAVLR